jgi:hypothetical protein
MGRTSLDSKQEGEMFLFSKTPGAHPASYSVDTSGSFYEENAEGICTAHRENLSFILIM